MKTPEEKINSIWNNKLKPFLCQKYPVTKNENVEFLIQEIDRIINNSQNIIESKSEISRKNKLNNIRFKTIYVNSKQVSNNENNKKEDNENTIKNKSKTMIESNNNEIKNEVIELQNKLKLRASATLKLKYIDSINMKNITLNIRNTFNIAKKKYRNKSLNEKELRKILIEKSFDINQYVNKVYIKDNDDINNKTENTLLQTKSMKKKIISANFTDEIASDKNIIYKNDKLKQISLNLLLKQIIFTDFIEKKENIEFLYNFSQQCFCFIKKENLFQKLINCYNYYKKLNTPFIQMKKLIYFSNLLIFEMYEYYKDMKISLDKNIKIFYKNLEAELLNLLEKKGKKEENIIIIKTKENNVLEEKIKFFKENVNNMDNQKISDSKNMKQKNEKILPEKEFDTIEKTLNNILLIISIFESKKNSDTINKIIKDNKKNLKLYKDYYLLKKEQSKISKSLIQLNKVSLSSPLKKINPKKNYYFSIFNYDPSEIGEVLLNITKTDLLKINRRELYNAIFTKKGKESLYPNVTLCITKINKLTTFIVEDILSYDLPKVRAEVIYSWLKVADYLRQRKDHNDCLAIYSAINHYTIAGLNLTKKEMKSKVKLLFHNIGDYCKIDANYKIFREEIHNCAKNKEFFLPFLGLLLKDIYFFNENFHYIIDDELEIINAEKIEKVQKTMDEFFAFKNINDNKKPINLNKELNFFDNLEIIKEEDLEMIANKLEPKFILNEKQKKGKRMTKLDKKYFIDKNFIINESSSIITDLGSFLIV